MDFLTNRDIALLIWIIPIFLFFALKAELRSALVSVLKAFVSPKILFIFVGLFVYVAAISYLLWLIGVWDISLLKATILWTIGAGIAGIFEVISLRDTRKLLSKAIRSQLGVIIFVEYVVTFQTFNLMVELLILPVLTFLVLLLSVSEGKPENEFATRFLNTLLSVFGLSLLIIGFTSIWFDPDSFWNTRTLKDFLLPILLSLLILPFHFALITLITFETRFIGLNFQLKDASLRSSAKRCALWHYAFDLDGLNRWFHEVAIADIQTISDLDSTFSVVKMRRAVEAKPPEIPVEDGWSPFAAMKFPRDEALRPHHYKQLWSGGEEWRASSNYVDLEKGAFANQLSYSIEGDAHVATRLLLSLDVRQMATETAALYRLMEELQAITDKMGLELRLDNNGALLSGRTFVIDCCNVTIKASRKDWALEGTYDFLVELVHKKHKTDF
ncbi:hypothetical protein [Hoeflea poritis]|uniref:Uncharacterized protein n=1 Tax=Hoeflea poritis TaxID=2993659 RepID=A0ABT4VMQ8_9HYPH|nr:hypothetical protein [Hoeflea poritis]MDA4845460.1 hypothetical protein [Hoeflea poritis]